MLLTKPNFLSLIVIIIIKTTHPGWDGSQATLNTFNVMIDKSMSTQQYITNENTITSTSTAKDYDKNKKVKHLTAWDCDLRRNMKYNEFNFNASQGLH